MTNQEVFLKFFNYPKLEDEQCAEANQPCIGIPCITCNWWNKEFVPIVDSVENAPVEIFISQPMKDKTDEEILQERKRIEDMWAGKAVHFIDSFFESGVSRNPLDSLGKSICLMRDADLVIFAPGWENARGCRIEHEAAVNYGKHIIEL